MKKRKKLNWKIPLLIVLVLLLVLLLGFAAHLRRTHTPQPPQHTDPVEETVSGTEETAAETVEETVSQTDPPAAKGAVPMELGEGIMLTGLAEATGNFPEDGSDEFLMSMLSATFRNDSDATLQYGKVQLTVNGVSHSFEFSTVPPGQTVRAFDLDKKEVPRSISEVEARVEYMVFFPEEPQRYEDKLQIEVDNGEIRVKNISDKDIPGEISLFYKNKYSGIYMGGITYRLRISGLKAGEEISGYASHAQKNATEIMFVTYDN